MRETLESSQGISHTILGFEDDSCLQAIHYATLPRHAELAPKIGTYMRYYLHTLLNLSLHKDSHNYQFCQIITTFSHKRDE